MKSTLFSLPALLFCCCPLFAQQPSAAQPPAQTKYNLLNVPVSPAFILLDAEPVTVEEPANPTDFFASLRNATTGFTALPNTYAINFAPGWMFGGSKFSYDDFASGRRVGQNIGQSALISMGVLTNTLSDTDNFTKASLGFKFSLWQGKADTAFGELHQKRAFLLRKVGELRQDLDEQAQALLEQDPNYVMLNNMINAEAQKDNPDLELIQSLQKSRDRVENEFRDRIVAGYESQLADIRDTIAQMIFRRYGFFFDVSGGAAFRFPNNTVGDAGMDRFGFWATCGFLTKKDLNIIATARLMNFQDQAFIDQGTGVLDVGTNLFLDAGARLVYRRHRFGLSAEGVLRQPLNNSGIDGTSRASFSLDYQVGENQVLDFTFGKNFDGTVEKGGNLIAIFNFLIGFGGKRPY